MKKPTPRASSMKTATDLTNKRKTGTKTAAPKSKVIRKKPLKKY